MSRLVFRADGTAQIGLGHVMRCLALAQMLKSDFELYFAIIEPPLAVRTVLENVELTVIPLPNTDSQSAFLEQIESDDIVVLDGYSFDESFQQSVRTRAKKLVFIDDLVTGHQVADVVINHAGGVEKSDYDAELYTQFYLGPHYALLRPEFLKPEGFGQTPSNGPIFVSLGGTDPNNLSLAVLEAIRKVDATLSVHLVLGPLQAHRKTIEAFQDQLPNLIIMDSLNASQMVALLQQCSLAITACSTISYEVCAINRPLIAVVTADNQTRLAKFLSEDKLAILVNFPTMLTRLTPILTLDNMVKSAIQVAQSSPEIVANSLRNQRRFFDGRSPERLRALFQKLSAYL
ncbi:UDP-2,4-diacetamido-2,4,6-trideoxy-beta-L-altropyranose hydrolase [Spirosoma harenae]